jgi:hypothetical protein
MRPTCSTPGGAGPQISPHAGQQFLESERLAQVVIGAEIEPCNPVVHAPPGTEHKDRNRRSAPPRAFKHVKAIQVGQPEIQDHE